MAFRGGMLTYALPPDEVPVIEPDISPKRPSYRFMVDGGSEGWSLWENEYPTVDEAVKAAMASALGAKFLIISIVDWKATE